MAKLRLLPVFSSWKALHSRADILRVHMASKTFKDVQSHAPEELPAWPSHGSARRSASFLVAQSSIGKASSPSACKSPGFSAAELLHDAPKGLKPIRWEPKLD